MTHDSVPKEFKKIYNSLVLKWQRYGQNSYIATLGIYVKLASGRLGSPFIIITKRTNFISPPTKNDFQ